MPRFYPEKDDCDIYVEKLIDGYHDARPHVLRKNQLKNQIGWFDDLDHEDPYRSVICSWGLTNTFRKNTALKSKQFVKSRLRRNCQLPTTGRRGMWKITRIGPVGMCTLPLHKWKLDEWLPTSSFRKSAKLSSDED